VLLLHGWPESWSAFERVMIALAPQAHVVAFDLPGVGQSTGLSVLSKLCALAQ